MNKNLPNDFDVSELEVILEITKLLKPRTTESRARILFYLYNFFKPQREDLDLPIPETKLRKPSQFQ